MANAQKSTGPRTAAGKARSRKNALKHGILSAETLITDGETKEDAATFEALREELQADLAAGIPTADSRRPSRRSHMALATRPAI